MRRTSEAAAEGAAQKRPAGEDAEGAGAAKQVKDADGAAQAAPSEAQAAPPDAAATSAQGEAPAAPAAAAAEAAPAGATEGEATDAAAAASDDDDGLVDEEADDIPNLVLAQYDKVRTFCDLRWCRAQSLITESPPGACVVCMLRRWLPSGCAARCGGVVGAHA